MSFLPICLRQRAAGKSCWRFLQDKKARLAVRGYDCEVSRHDDPATGSLRLCFHWVPSIEPPHPSVTDSTSRDYVLELTARPNGDVVFSYSGCGIDTRKNERRVSTGAPSERELEDLFVEFDIASRRIHHDCFVSLPQECWVRRSHPLA